MIFCKRCGSSTLNGYCSNCYGSNFVFEQLFNFRIGNGLNISPLTERNEQILRLKTNFMNKKNFLPKIQPSTSINEKILQTTGKVTAIKAKENFNLLNQNNKNSIEQEGDLERKLEPTDNLINYYPHVKTMLDLKRNIEKNISFNSDFQEYKLALNEKKEKKPKIQKSKKDVDTQIYEIKD